MAKHGETVKVRKKAPRVRRCGEFGGVGRGGNPCGRTVKHGGKCKAHNTDAVDALVALKEAFLEHFGTGVTSLREAAELAGSSAPTVWRMRQDDPAFDDAIRATQLEVDRLRVAMVEDSLFKRVYEGACSAAEMIFFLVNRSPKRWRSVQHVQSSTFNVDVSSLTQLQLRRIVAGEDPMIVLAETQAPDLKVI